MAVIVQKFGGTSVADMGRIKAVADRVEAAVAAGDKVAVVLSAMAGVTNQLVDWINQAGAGSDGCEYDSVVSTGEQVTVGLLACVLQGRGLKARSWLGWQLPIHTDGVHGRARITSVETEAIRRGLDHGEVQVVAGFQGISDDGRIATLGRGGSDITAVALAAAIDAERCDIEREMGRKMDCVDNEVGAELIAKFSCLAQVGHRAKCVRRHANGDYARALVNLL